MHISLKHIMCPIDFSENSEHALLYAATLAKSYEATLHLIHVVQPSMTSVTGDPYIPEFSAELMQEISAAAKQRLEDIAAPLKAEIPQVVIQMCTGAPFVEIIEAARTQDIDLIVMGTHGRTGLVHMMIGSVAEKVVRKAPCPVLTVKHPEHEFVMP
jgi:nucleotide-binding universal stress UspA family protein